MSPAGVEGNKGIDRSSARFWYLVLVHSSSPVPNARLAVGIVDFISSYMQYPAALLSNALAQNPPGTAPSNRGDRCERAPLTFIPGMFDLARKCLLSAQFLPVQGPCANLEKRGLVYLQNCKAAFKCSKACRVPQLKTKMLFRCFP